MTKDNKSKNEKVSNDNFSTEPSTDNTTTANGNSTAKNNKTTSYTTENSIYQDAVTSYFANLNGRNPTPDEVEAELLLEISLRIGFENRTRPKGDKFSNPKRLPPSVIAVALMELNNVVRLSWTGIQTDTNLCLACYIDNGSREGLYSTDVADIRRLVRQYNFKITDRDVKEVIAILTDEAPVRELNIDPDLIPLANGIFDYRTKELRSFSPEYVFTAKSAVNYIPNAVKPVIHNDDDGTDWDFDSWLDTLTDDPEIVKLLWQIIGAVIRPNVTWDKAIFMYGPAGCGGKGTLCVLLKNLVGQGNYASVPLDRFGERFGLTELLHAMAVIVDENDCNAYNRTPSKLKAAITGDSFDVERKNLPIVTMRFHGLMVQTINSYPRFSDKTSSLYRRLLIVPLEKCFTGIERKYIKSDYLNRQEVLEYVLFKVLNIDEYYKFDEPTACKVMLGDYQQVNDPVRQFCDEIIPICKWDLLPLSFLYDLYKAYMQKNNPHGTLLGKRAFTDDLKDIFRNSKEWKFADYSVTTGSLMDKPEPLILAFDLVDWRNPVYTGSDPDQICKPALASSYKGLRRI